MALEVNGPYVVGATGGSGTRLAAQLMSGSGIHIGKRLNDAQDAIEVGLFLNKWIPAYVASVHQGLAMAPDLVTEMTREWKSAITLHLADDYQAGQPYGWKEPRSLYLLPFWHARYPELRFLHLIRDGRDMAFSSNQNQLRLYGDAMLPQLPPDYSAPLRSIALWSKVNAWAADYGERHMTGQYLRIRFEDLCKKPMEAGVQLLAFFGIHIDPHSSLLDEILAPSSLGRWRDASPELLLSLVGLGNSALERFGYR